MKAEYHSKPQPRPQIVLRLDRDDVLIVNAEFEQLAGLERAGRAALASAQAVLAAEAVSR